MAMHFFFLRHGPSEWNHQKRWQGQQDPKLSEEGAALVAELAGKIADVGFSRVWSSDLQRASSTAEIIADALKIEVALDKRLRERFLSNWEGLTRKEIDTKWPGAIEKREFPKDAESNQHITKRVLNFLEEKTTQQVEGQEPAATDEKNLVVSHGGLITCLEEYLGMEWQPLSNLKGRWLYIGERDKKLQLGDRVAYLEV